MHMHFPGNRNLNSSPIRPDKPERSTGLILFRKTVWATLFMIAGCSFQQDETVQSPELFVPKENNAAVTQVAIIKADDFTPGPDSLIDPRWQTFIDYTREQGIKSSMGIIGVSFLAGKRAFFDTVTALGQGPTFEFWNHGYLHLVNVMDSLGNTYSEFQGTSFQYQKSHLKLAQKLVKDSTHLTMKGFGAPGNQVDDVTTQVMELKPFKLEYWFYGLPSTNIFVFDRTCKTESGTGHPDFDLFLSSYDPDAPYLILQIHPKEWADSDYAEFDLIVGFIKDKGVSFVLPSDYLGLR